MTAAAQTEDVWWYEYDVVPIVGFVRADNYEQAKAAALDAATDVLRDYLTDASCKLERIEPCRKL